MHAPRPVFFVLAPGVLLLDFAGVAEPFRVANALGPAAPARFTLHVCGPRAQLCSSLPVGLTDVEPLPDALADDALVVVVGLSSAAVDDDSRAAQLRIVDWLRGVVAPVLTNGATRLLTVCSGAFMAAAAGLLDGRACTTHHSLTERLATQFPRARVQHDRIYVVDGPVATSAGITAGIDIALHAIGECVGTAAALAVARELVVYHRRAAGDPQLSPMLLHRNHLHAGIHRAQDAVLAAPRHPWTVAELAGAANTSARHLARLFHEHMALSPLAYLQSLRLALAQELLKDRALSVEQVAERAGFSSAHHLRRAWRAQLEGSPGVGRTADATRPRAS